MIGVEDGRSLLNAIKQQIFIPHLFWSRCCYYYKSGYHSLVSNSARDFHKLFKNRFCLCTLVSKVQHHLAPSQRFRPHLMPVSTLLTTDSHTDLVHNGDFAWFPLSGICFYPCLHLNVFFLSFKSQLKCYILREFSVDESIKYLSSSDVLFNIIGYITVKALHSIHLVSLCIYY